MQLVSSQPIVLIGPGSEWFWTAISGLVLVVTFLAIFRQLRVGQRAEAAATLEGFEKEWYSERFTRYKLQVLMSLRDGPDPSALPHAAASKIANFWSKIGDLARSGNSDVDLLARSYGVDGLLWWGYLKPWITATRIALDDPSAVDSFEWLAATLLAKEGGRSAGSASTPWTVPLVERLIGSMQDQLRVEEALRTVTIAPSRMSPDASIESNKARTRGPRSRRSLDPT